MDSAAGAFGDVSATAAGAVIQPGQESTDFATMRNAAMATTNAAMEVELLTGDDLLRSDVTASVLLVAEMMMAIFAGQSDAEASMREFGDRLATIQTRMADELAAS
jgi:hypothetical protein